MAANVVALENARRRREEAKQRSQLALRGVFDSIDADGSGLLDKDEMLGALSKITKPDGQPAFDITSRDVLRKVKKAAGADNEIDFEEFCDSIGDLMDGVYELSLIHI